MLIAESLSLFQVLQDVRFDAFYAQEQYTTGRFTFQGAVRFDHAWSYFPDETVGPVRFLTTPVTFAQNDPASRRRPHCSAAATSMARIYLPVSRRPASTTSPATRTLRRAWGMAWDVTR